MTDSRKSATTPRVAVLVVEDDPVIRKLIKVHLSGFQVDVFEAASAQAALTARLRVSLGISIAIAYSLACQVSVHRSLKQSSPLGELLQRHFARTTPPDARPTPGFRLMTFIHWTQKDFTAQSPL